MGYAPSGTTYPNSDAANAMNVWIGRSHVERDHWRLAAERQQHVYRHVRPVVFSWDSSRLNGLGFDAGPLSTSQTSYPSTPNGLLIPSTSALWTADDYDANVGWNLYALAEVTGVGNGYVRFTGTGGGGWTYEWVGVAPQALVWVAASQALPKNVIGQGISVDMKVSLGTATVKLHHVAIVHPEQGTIGG